MARHADTRAYAVLLATTNPFINALGDPFKYKNVASTHPVKSTSISLSNTGASHFTRTHVNVTASRTTTGVVGALRGAPRVRSGADRVPAGPIPTAFTAISSNSYLER